MIIRTHSPIYLCSCDAELELHCGPEVMHFVCPVCDHREQVLFEDMKWAVGLKPPMHPLTVKL